jgi:hypothetical protein
MKHHPWLSTLNWSRIEKHLHPAPLLPEDLSTRKTTLTVQDTCRVRLQLNQVLEISANHQCLFEG